MEVALPPRPEPGQPPRPVGHCPRRASVCSVGLVTARCRVARRPHAVMEYRPCVRDGLAERLIREGHRPCPLPAVVSPRVSRNSNSEQPGFETPIVPMRRAVPQNPQKHFLSEDPT